MTEVQDRVRLRWEIEEAFAAVPYPGDDAIVSHGCWECDEAASAFKGKRWQDYADRPLALVGPPNRDALPLLTPQAFRYYLPLALLAAVDLYKEADILTDSIIFALLPEQTKSDARLSLLAEPELRALLSFLEYLRKHHPVDYVDGPRKKDLDSAERRIRSRLDQSKSV